MRACWWCSALLALGAAGCGQPSPDLFDVRRSGGEGPLRVVVSDGGSVRCDGGEPRPLDADQLLDARELARDLAEPAALGLELPAGPGAVLSYRVRLESGRVAFADTSRNRPQAFNALAAYVDRLEEDVCPAGGAGR